VCEGDPFRTWRRPGVEGVEREGTLRKGHNAPPWTNEREEIKGPTARWQLDHSGGIDQKKKRVKKGRRKDKKAKKSGKSI